MTDGPGNLPDLGGPRGTFDSGGSPTAEQPKRAQRGTWGTFSLTLREEREFQIWGSGEKLRRFPRSPGHEGNLATARPTQRWIQPTHLATLSGRMWHADHGAHR